MITWQTNIVFLHISVNVGAEIDWLETLKRPYPSPLEEYSDGLACVIALISTDKDKLL
jgi:hypothetical protein